MNLEFSHKTKEIFFFERLFHSRFQTKQSFISFVGLCHLFSRGFNQNIMIYVKEIKYTSIIINAIVCQKIIIKKIQ